MPPQQRAIHHIQINGVTVPKFKQLRWASCPPRGLQGFGSACEPLADFFMIPLIFESIKKGKKITCCHVLFHRTVPKLRPSQRRSRYVTWVAFLECEMFDSWRIFGGGSALLFFVRLGPYRRQFGDTTLEREVRNKRDFQDVVQSGVSNFKTPTTCWP